MANLIIFNATDWIAENAYGGTRLTPEAQEAISSFTTMWNFFESTLCDNRASVAAFKRSLERYRPENLSKATAQALADCLAFWQFRYRTPEGFGKRFDGLYFRPADHRAHVEAVLAADVAGPKDQMLALMIIIYRLRNNLFHGLKSLEMLNDQVQNLANATRCMAAILEAIPSRWVRHHQLQAENG